MKKYWFLAGVICILVHAALRIITLNSATPVWAATLRPMALVAAFVCLALAASTHHDEARRHGTGVGT